MVSLNKKIDQEGILESVKRMKYEFYSSSAKSILGLTEDIARDWNQFTITERTIKIIWNRNKATTRFIVDDYEVALAPNQLVTLTYLQQVSFSDDVPPLTAFTFNKEFYCISDHDHEVSCNGILFFGTQDLPIITIPEDQELKFNTLYAIFVDEFTTPDQIQGDMLQMLLKRLIIIATRLAKTQLIVQKLDNDQIDVIRKFNVLVDEHYKTKRKVSDYADLLFKSPKTLSNLFGIYNQKSPQQLIQERIALEARRMLHFTGLQNQEIAYELGFNDPAHFSKFFKKMTGFSPTEYRDSKEING